MRVTVDEMKCRGHARCQDILPEVFAWNDLDDRAYVPEDADFTGKDELIQRAVEACPERAIIVVDD